MREYRRDAPFWAGVVVVVFSLGALGCLGVAAAQAARSGGAEIVAPDFEALSTPTRP